MIPTFEEVIEYVKTEKKEKNWDFFLCEAYGALLKELNGRYRRKELSFDDAVEEKEEMRRQYQQLKKELNYQRSIWAEHQKALIASKGQISTALKMIKGGGNPEAVLHILSHLISLMTGDSFLEREVERRWRD